MSATRRIGLLPLFSIALLGLPTVEATGVPALANPGFEDDGTGVPLPEAWTSVGTEGADFTELGGHSGSFRLTHWSPTDYAVDTRQTLSRLRDGWYTLRGWVKRSAGANDSYVELECGSHGERAYLPVAAPDQWLQVVVSNRVRHGSCTVALHTAALGGEWSNFDDIELVPGRVRLSTLGADVSSLNKSEDMGGVYYDERGGGQQRHPRSALRILEDHGVSHIRLRVWVDPADGYHDRAELLEMARRAATVRTWWSSRPRIHSRWPTMTAGRTSSALRGQLVSGYPATPQGQAPNFRDVMSIVRAVPNGRGLGVFYWDATWTGVVGNGWDPTDPSSGNAWENQALFGFDDRPLPAMNEFQR